MDEKLIELMRKCEELYDMSNKKYSDSVWKEKLWGQIIGEVLKIHSAAAGCIFDGNSCRPPIMCCSGR